MPVSICVKPADIGWQTRANSHFVWLKTSFCTWRNTTSPRQRIASPQRRTCWRARNSECVDQLYIPYPLPKNDLASSWFSWFLFRGIFHAWQRL